MLVSWTDKDGRNHTGDKDGRAYKRHLAAQAKAAAKPSEPVGTIESGLVRTVPDTAPAPEAADPAGEPAPTAEPRKRR